MPATICGPSNAITALSCLRLCPVCDADNQNEDTLPCSQAPWKLKGCRECGTIYLENPPPLEALVDDFSWTSTFKEETAKRRVARPVLSRVSNFWNYWRKRILPRRKLEGLISRYVKAGKLLDIGCGTAEHFDRLPESITPFGVEIDPQAIADAKERVLRKGGEIIHAAALDGIKQFESGSVSGIVMHSFLEHEANPLELLRAAHESLKVGGVVIIKVPNFSCWNRRYFRPKDWPGFRFPDHVNYFTPESLQALVERSGLRVLRFSFWDRVPSNDNMWLIATR